MVMDSPQCGQGLVAAGSRTGRAVAGSALCRVARRVIGPPVAASPASASASLALSRALAAMSRQGREQ